MYFMINSMTSMTALVKNFQGLDEGPPRTFKGIQGLSRTCKDFH
jgi:hypothetical protein